MLWPWKLFLIYAMQIPAVFSKFFQFITECAFINISPLVCYLLCGSVNIYRYTFSVYRQYIFGLKTSFLLWIVPKFQCGYINFHFPSDFWGKFPYILGNLRKLSAFRRNMWCLVIFEEIVHHRLLCTKSPSNFLLCNSVHCTVGNEKCDSHVCLLSSNFILAYKLNFR